MPFRHKILRIWIIYTLLTHFFFRLRGTIFFAFRMTQYCAQCRIQRPRETKTNQGFL